MIRLETKRLILRNWSLADASDLFDYAKLDTVGPKAGWKPHEAINESIEIIKRFIAADDVWAVEHKEDNKVIGSVGMHRKDNETDRLTRELGYVLSTKYENQGLMTEACQAVLAHTFNDTDIDTVVVSHFQGNHKSQRVIEKCGFIFVEEGEYVTIDKRRIWSRYYKLTKNQYILNGGKQ